MRQEALLQAIRSAFQQGQYRLTAHSLQEATADAIAVEDIRNAIIGEGVEIVEDYPDDPRGPSCLILGWTAAGRPLHIVISYPPDVAVITVYKPDPERWLDYRTRR